MLENEGLSYITTILTAPGPGVESLDITSLEKGRVVRVKTKSGNYYLFKISDPKPEAPKIPRAHVVRCMGRPMAPKTGYRGERMIHPAIFKIGENIFHDNSNTSPIAEIVLI